MVANKMTLLTYLLGASGLAQLTWAFPTEQLPLQADDNAQTGRNVVHATKQRPLHGRFLHMTGE